MICCFAAYLSLFMKTDDLRCYPTRVSRASTTNAAMTVSTAAATTSPAASPLRRRPTDAASASKLHEIYDEMRTRQQKAIRKAGTMRSDPFFVPDAKLNGAGSVAADALSGDISTDDRRCLAVSSVIDESVDCHWTDAFHDLQKRLREEFSPYGLTFSQHPPPVGAGQLHWTLMQLVGFPDYDSEVLLKQSGDAATSTACNTVTGDGGENRSVYLSAEYLDCVQDSLMVGGLDTGIHIQYAGVVLVATGLLMVGVPSLDINAARDVVRNRLSDNNLPLKEPFVNDIVHSTLYRVAGDPADMPKDLHVRLMKLAKEFESINLGTVVLNKFQIGPASWRVLSHEMETTPPARKWELPVETPSESFNENVLNERGYTVSGASGANLAKELRQVLSRQTSEVDDRKGQVAVDAGLPFMRPLTPPRGEDGEDGHEDLGGEKISPNAAAGVGMDEMKNFHEEVRERIDTLHVRDSIPQASSAKVEEDSLATCSTATISGAAGLALSQELQKKLMEEQRALDRMYYTDFY